MLDAFLQGLVHYADPAALGFLVAGVSIGIFIGIVPAIGGLTAMALLLPLTFGMEKVAGLSLLMAITAISSTGGSITSILMNIPGEGTSVATMLDGFPMTQKGEAGRALGAMLLSASLGSLLGVVLGFVMIPVVRPLVMAMGKPELFLVIVLGLSLLAVLSKEAPVKGLISGFLGIFISLIGFQESTGVARLTFGSTVLFGKLDLIPVTMGLFAGAELSELGAAGESVVPVERVRAGRELRRQIHQGMRDVFAHRWLWFRSCVLGYLIGVIPGIGGGAATFVAYGMAKHTSRDPERYGTGCVEGVIAPEAASNAKEGGALLTTLALGLPGSTSMAFIIGALLMHGIIPGPEMLRNEVGLAFTLFWGLALANVIGGALCYVIAGYCRLSRIVALPSRYLVPVTVALVLLGSYVTNGHLGDLVVTIVFTGVGLLMKRFGYNRASLLLGFILGLYFEEFFWISLQSRGALFFLRPGCLAVLAVMVCLYSLEPVKKLLARRARRAVPA
ncbi:MAG: tripartite tricarboxylate transporter permease [Deltaproteobacteria bacterium]|nr:tripartite tricarboxylate transporter permease [Deltaproteobacteria bacterium]